jgi:flagellar biosynthesis protein FlhA
MSRLKPILKFLTGSKDLTIVAFVMLILAIIIVPLPSALLDVFLALSLSVSILIILIALYIPKPTDLTTFPTLILIIVLFRLSLNIATTRMILLEGHNGPTAVSDIITSFGEFVVGGNMVVGIIVFIILVLINFMVVTNGATRVAEVNARFTLDAMPGRQMAIDADLNAGLIEEEEAKKRRAELLQEADFYGSMDGSSKFVKGDAIAGIIITLVNLIAGFLIGMMQYDMSFTDSASTFTILTIGDGLVSQLPALITSTATGIIITRGSKDKDNFAEGAINQLMGDTKSLTIVGIILFAFSLVPGLPSFSLATIGAIFMLLSYSISKSKEGGSIFDIFPDSIKSKFEDNGGAKQSKSPLKKDLSKQDDNLDRHKPKQKKDPEQIKKEEEKKLDEALKTEILELVLGYQLVKLANEDNGDLLDRIRQTRVQVAQQQGFITPKIRIRDNLQIQPNHYQIVLKGVEIGSGEIEPDRFMALDNHMVVDKLDGIATTEPAFGLPAIWIAQELKQEAITRGYTVIDPSTVVITHLSELIKKHSEELLTRQEVRQLLDKTKESYPIIAEDAEKAVANLGVIQSVLRELLHERIPIKDMVTILETIADVAPITQKVDILTEQVRSRMARVITNTFKGDDGRFRILTLEPATEQYLLNKMQVSGDERNLLINVGEINRLIQETSVQIEAVLQQNVTPPIVIVVDPLLRKSLSMQYERFNVKAVILSHNEIDQDIQFEVLGSIKIDF